MISRLSGRGITLIHSPTFNFESYQREVMMNRGYYAYPPRGIQCLAAALEKSGTRARILDLNFLLLERLRAEPHPVDLYALLINILDEHRDEESVFGVSTGVIVPNLFLADRHPFLEILSHLMASAQMVIAGGPCATIEARNLIEGGFAHVVIKGEAEEKLDWLLGADIPQPAGICYLENGEMVETDGSTAMVHFEQSVIATYDQIAIERYHEVGCLSPFSRMAGTHKRYCSLQLIRGCRMRCTFCGLIQYRGSNEVCRYPVDLLFEELEYLVKERGIEHFEWVDEDLLADREAIIEFLERVAKADFKITWAADIGLIAVYLDRPLLDLMEASGCIGFRIGVESGNADILRRIKKPATLPKLRNIAALLQDYPRFFVVGLFMLGFEGETYGQMFDTLDFAVEMKLSWCHFCVYQEIKESDRFISHDLRGYKDWLPSNQKVVGSSAVGLGAQTRTPEFLMALPRDEAHDPAMKQELWFMFNLYANYVNNKNLAPGGDHDAFIRWVSGLQLTYPHHPVMSRALAMAHGMAGRPAQQQVQQERMRRDLAASAYWQKRFEDYRL